MLNGVKKEFKILTMVISKKTVDKSNGLKKITAPSADASIKLKQAVKIRARRVL